MAQLITWTPVDYATVDGQVGGHHVVRIRFLAEGGWKVHPVPADQGTLSARYDSLEGAKRGAELWWLGYLGSLGAAPAVPDLNPEELATLVTDVRAAVLRHSSVDYHIHRLRAEAAVKYMDDVISPSHITLEHIRRILQGEA